MTDTIEELPTFLIPLQKSNLLLPNNTIAEIIPYEPLQRVQNTPDWFLGLLNWRGMQVPVVSFEMLTRAGASFSLMSVASASLVICTALGGSEEMPYFALVAQSLPRLMRLTSDELKESHEQTLETELLIVRLNGQPATIPDLSYIESSLSAVEYY
jgi:chemosensory pili system protein ChpC